MHHAKDAAPAAAAAGGPRAATHCAIDAELCGEPLELAPGFSRVTFTPTPRMAADERGLVHGGFPFGAADYAAMLAVNDPHVVLASAEVRFLAPVRVGESLVAEARVVDEGHGGGGRAAKPRVEVILRRGEEAVFRGSFGCYVPPRHVLATAEETDPEAGS